MRKGFTLVELSIVLVIIGLLIGGILVAQTMVSTSKITSVISQVSQFDAGVISFKAKYNALPGDAKTFGGDNNKLITSESSQLRVYSFRGEIANFWNNLNSDQFSAGNGFAVSTSGATRNVPLSKIGKPGSFFTASAYGTNYADTANPRNFYAIMDPSQGAINFGSGNFGWQQITVNNSAVDPVSLYSLDTKIDDGIANAGNVLSGGVPCGHAAVGECFGGIYNTTNHPSCSNNGSYITTYKNYSCTPLIRIGAAVGDLQ